MPARFEDEPEPVLLWEGDAPGTPPGSSANDEVLEVRWPGFREGWEGDAAGERIIRNVHCPSITPFLPELYSPERPNAAVILIPGGAHEALCWDLEGTFVARWLIERGVAAFVLKYRMARAKGSPYELEHCVLDTERAVRTIRSRAAEWAIDPDRIGVMGFSAGGYPAAHASMHTGSGDASATDPVERFSSRPNFQALIYPHMLGCEPAAGHPPAFLLASYYDGDGRGNIKEAMGYALAELYLKFRLANVPAELHMYANVANPTPHGHGLRPMRGGAIHAWADRFLEWLETACPPGGRPLLSRSRM